MSKKFSSTPQEPCFYCGFRHKESFEICSQCGGEFRLAPPRSSRIVEQEAESPDSLLDHSYEPVGATGFDRIIRIGMGLTATAAGIYLLSHPGILNSLVFDLPASSPQSATIAANLSDTAQPLIHLPTRLFGGVSVVGGILSSINGFIAA